MVDKLSQIGSRAQNFREKMANRFDFRDGLGPVPAHKHPNGGGWVANSASVDSTVYVGPDARVYGKTYVSGNTRVSGTSRVYGNAVVSNANLTNSNIYGNASLYMKGGSVRSSHIYGDVQILETRKGGIDVKNSRITNDTQVSHGDKNVMIKNAKIYGKTRIMGGDKFNLDVSGIQSGTEGKKSTSITYVANTPIGGTIYTPDLKDISKDVLAKGP